MDVKIKRIPQGVPLKYFYIDAAICSMFWDRLTEKKHLVIHEIQKSIMKPKNYLAFTFIGFDINYAVHEQTNIVHKLTIYETVIIYLPKWRQIRFMPFILRNRYLKFLKKAFYHEYRYNVLKSIKHPTYENVSDTIKQFQNKLIIEQEWSHARAPKGKPFC